MICYAFLGYGPKPPEGTVIGNLPAARTQLANFRKIVNLPRVLGLAPKIQVVWDHARVVDDLASLPRLRKALQTAKAGEGCIFVDDIERILRKCDLHNRQSLLEELLRFGEQIRVIRLNKKLAAFNHAELLHAVAHPRTTAFRLPDTRKRELTPEEWQDRTESARLQSEWVRGKQADARAATLALVRSELQKDNTKVTLAMIAEEANQRGLTSARGGKWSAATVQRALARLDPA